MKVDLPYEPVSGVMFNFARGRCATGWLFEELIGHQEFYKYCVESGNTTQPVMLLSKIAHAEPSIELVLDLNKIVCTNDNGCRNPDSYYTAFRMLADLLENHRDYFNKVSSRTDATLAKIQGIMERNAISRSDIAAFRKKLCASPPAVLDPQSAQSQV